MFDTKDILLFENGNGGEIALINNDIALTEQLYQQVYLCLFGGNIEASTRGDELATEIRKDWWGNSLQFKDTKAKQFNSETEKALNTNPLNSNGRINILRAVESDLSLFKTVADLSVNVVIMSYSQVKITVKMTQPQNQQGVSLQLVWDNAKKELITQQII